MNSRMRDTILYNNITCSAMMKVNGIRGREGGKEGSGLDLMQDLWCGVQTSYVCK